MQEIESAASPRDWDRSWTFGRSSCCRAIGTAPPTRICSSRSSRGCAGISIYFKDKSTHPTGSLKHRLAHSLFLFGICNGKIREGTTVVEASSGSTAVSEAYFAQLLGLPFIAVMPRSTSRSQDEAIERFGGRCHFVEAPAEVYTRPQRLAREAGGHYLDQFTNAERATDWRGNNNIAESIFSQMEAEAHPAARVDRDERRDRRHLGDDRALHPLPQPADAALRRGCGAFGLLRGLRHGRQVGHLRDPSRIEGIGRPRVEPSFIPGAIDHMMRVPDAASIAAAHVLSERLFRRVGGSTGTNFYGLCQLAAEMMREGREGSLVTLICDSGDRYASTYFDPDWLRASKIDIEPYRKKLEKFLDTGELG